MITIHKAFTTEQITIDQAKKLLTAARKVLESALSGHIKNDYRGICNILNEWSYSRTETFPYGVSIALVCRCAVRWKHKAAAFPGSYTAYPIKENPNFGKWEGPNLEARISLLRYVIKRLRDAIRRAEKNGKATLR